MMGGRGAVINHREQRGAWRFWLRTPADIDYSGIYCLHQVLRELTSPARVPSEFGLIHSPNERAVFFFRTVGRKPEKSPGRTCKRRDSNPETFSLGR